jgi:1,4-dihydroxy-2-naphthoate octaprenyltransferase
MSAHFINVLKDMKEDHVSGIKGLPQRLGTRGSVLAAVVLIILGVTILILSL